MQEGTPKSGEQEFDPLAERFFSQPPPAWEIEPDEWFPEPLSSLERAAMLITAAPLMALLAVGLGALFAPPPITSRAVTSPAHVEPAPPSAPIAVDPPALEPAPSSVQVAVAVQERSPAAQSNEPSPPTSRAAPARAEKRRGSRGVSSAVKRARQLLDGGDAAAARDMARGIVRKVPERAAGYIVLGAALDKLGDSAGKLAVFRRCVELATDPLASACRTLARGR